MSEKRYKSRHRNLARCVLSCESETYHLPCVSYTLFPHRSQAEASHNVQVTKRVPSKWKRSRRSDVAASSLKARVGPGRQNHVSRLPNCIWLLRLRSAPGNINASVKSDACYLAAGSRRPSCSAADGYAEPGLRCSYVAKTRSVFQFCAIPPNFETGCRDGKDAGV